MISTLLLSQLPGLGSDKSWLFSADGSRSSRKAAPLIALRLMLPICLWSTLACQLWAQSNADVDPSTTAASTQAEASEEAGMPVGLEQASESEAVATEESSADRSGAGQGLDSQELLKQEQAAFLAASDRAARCVVQIEIFGGLERVGQELIAEGPTSGTIVDPDGWIISSLYSFRQKPASILVSLPDGSRAAARIVARDYSRELALLKIEGQSDLPYAQPSHWLAEPPEQLVGRWVIALGKTYDKMRASQSVGIISAVGRAYDRAIQTDAKVSPINYGGPLVDLTGRIVGILSPLSPGEFLEGDSTQLYDSGIGFAIPLDDVLERLPQMQSGQDVRPGKLGIVSSEQNEFAGPVRVVGAMPGSPAAKTGVKAGDLLVFAEGREIRLLADLKHALGPVDAGSPFRFSVERDGERLELQAELTDAIPVYRRRYLGLRLKPAASGADGGLEIVAVEPESPAAETRLAPGQIVLRCDGEQLRSERELRNRIAVAELDTPLVLEVEKKNDELSNRAADNEETAGDGPDDRDTTNNGAAETTQRIELIPTTWPITLPDELPPAYANLNENLSSSFVEITIGDFSNNAFALVPPLAAQRDLGMLILFPEPGELDRDAVQQAWGKFATEQGWIIAVINSRDPSRWSAEELELAGRVLGRIKNGYQIDEARTVIGGLGVGGRMALLAASMQPEKVSAVLTVGTNLGRLRARVPNSPLRSVDYLLVGDTQALAPAAENLSNYGYAATVLDGGDLAPQELETHPQAEIQRWLAGLARF